MIDRESVIEHSVEAYLRSQLFTIRQYPASKVVMLDAYPDDARMSKPLDKNYIAIGWAADDGGKDAEIGTTAKRRKYTFDFYVFGISRVWAKNLASVIRYSLEADGVISLTDPVGGGNVGYVDIDFVSAQQAVTPNPRPWQENAWITRLRVEDSYYSSARGG